MRLSEMLARSARPKRRAPRQTLDVVAGGKHLPTPIVVDRGHRQPKTKRSKRRNKVRAFEAAMRKKFSHRGHREE